MKKLSVIITLVAFSLGLSAQDFGYGFKTGLNFNTVQTDEVREGEEFDNNTGFHIGAIFAYKMTDLMGFRAELLYSQKGGRIRTNGFGVTTLETANGQTVLISGQRTTTLKLSNSYIDIPITFYAKPLSWLELHAGANVGFLATSIGIGQLTFDGSTTINNQNFEVPQFDYDYNFNYGKDVFDQGVPTDEMLVVGSEDLLVPSRVGAYYEQDQDYGNVYNRLDFGLVGGVSFFLTKGLFASLRANYGLSDITNNEADRVTGLNDDATGITTVAQNHKDTNLSIQASVGFSF